eukprot:8657801-Prorocentrum_lima.AAC.1
MKRTLDSGRALQEAEVEDVGEREREREKERKAEKSRETTTPTKRRCGCQLRFPYEPNFLATSE